MNTTMKKTMLGVLIAAALGGHGVAGAACSDDALSPAAYEAIQRNGTLGSVIASIPCAAPSPETYTDAIGREFRVYSWVSENKAITVETYQNRVFNKSAQNISFQSATIVPGAVEYDPGSSVMSIPFLTLVDANGAEQVVYDARVLLTEAGQWSLLNYDTTQRGDVRYDTRGQTASKLNLQTGELVVPNLKTETGAVTFIAKLNPDGTWEDLSNGQPVINNPAEGLPVADVPAYSPANGVVTVPVMTLVTPDGSRKSIYDVQLQLSENGGWALLSYKELAAGEELPYDVTGALAALIDLELGRLTLPELLVGEDAIAFRAKLNPDGTWADLSDAQYYGRVSNVGSVPLETAPLATAPTFDATKRVVTVPAMVLIGADGSRQVVYDASILLAEGGGWALLNYTALPEGAEAPYSLDGYLMSALDLGQGSLSIPELALEEGANSVVFRAMLRADGTWVDVSDGSAFGVISNTGTSGAREAVEQLAGEFQGLASGGFLEVQGSVYQSVGTCSIPSGKDSTKSVPGVAGSTYQAIPDDPLVTVYQTNGTRYLTVEGWSGSCEVRKL